MLNDTTITEALRNVQDPELHRDIVSLDMVKEIHVDGEAVALKIDLTTPACPLKDQIGAEVESKVKALGATDVSIEWGAQVRRATSGQAQQENLVPGVKNIIAVASGKGGVGKSTTSVNLALALAAEGATVGVLDADIYGPSQPRMLGISGKPESKDGNTLEPLTSYNLQAMSIGFLIDEETPMIWRGPMVTQALEQLLNDTNWDELDYLIIDLPPGTGDTQLTLAQKVPVSGAVVVTTPQDIALLDARKGFKMFEKVEVPVLGIVENMSIHICSKCGHEEHIFGEGGGERMASEYGVNFLGALPLETRIREETDAGKPTVVAEPDARPSLIYREIARKAAAKLSRQAKNYSAKFPNIVIQNN